MTFDNNSPLPEEILAAFTRIQNMFAVQADAQFESNKRDKTVTLPMEDMATLLMGFMAQQEAIMASWRLANTYASALNIIDEGSLIVPEHQKRIHDFCKNLALTLVDDYATLRVTLTERQAASVLPSAEIIPFPSKTATLNTNFNA